MSLTQKQSVNLVISDVKLTTVKKEKDSGKYYSKTTCTANRKEAKMPQETDKEQLEVPDKET